MKSKKSLNLPYFRFIGIKTQPRTTRQDLRSLTILSNFWKCFVLGLFSRCFEKILLHVFFTYEITCLARDDSNVRAVFVSFRQVLRFDFFVILKWDSRLDHSLRRMKPISDKFIKYDMIRISNESGAKSKIILYTWVLNWSPKLWKSRGNLEKGRAHDLS